MPFNIGPGEIIIILVIALIVVGPGKLPDVGSALGKSIREFRKAATDVKESTSMEPAASPAAPAPAPGTAAPVTSSVPPAPVAAVAAATPIIADAASAPASVAAPEPEAAASVPAPETAVPAATAAEAGEWPTELAPADEQQPAPSA